MSLTNIIVGLCNLFILDKIIPHLHIFAKREEAEGMETNWRKTILLVLAIALHNIPEGLAVGVALEPLLVQNLLECQKCFPLEQQSH